MMVLSKCLSENYPIMLTMVELSEILQFCQKKKQQHSEKQFKYFTAVLDYTVIAYLIIHYVHYYLHGKLS